MKRLLTVLLALLILAGCSSNTKTLDTESNFVTQIKEFETSPKSVETTTKITTTTSATTGAEEYVKSCEIVEYDELARNTASYVDRDIAYFAKVLQIVQPESGNQYYMRLAVSDSFSIEYKDVILATFYADEPNILEGDVISVFGKCKGKESYESVLGEKITLPLMEIWYMSEIDSSQFVQIDENGNQSFVFQDLRITISPEYSFTTIDNKYNDNFGSEVIIIPATVAIVSDETKYLYSGDVKMFGSAGTALDTVHLLFDDGDDIFNDLRKGASLNGNFYLIYDGDGDYYLEFRDFEFTLEIRYPVTK